MSCSLFAGFRILGTRGCSIMCLEETRDCHDLCACWRPWSSHQADSSHVSCCSTHFKERPPAHTNRCLLSRMQHPSWLRGSVMVMQDYEMALSTLRLLCSDLKTDKKWRQYAGAQVQMYPFRTCMLVDRHIATERCHHLAASLHAVPLLVGQEPQQTGCMITSCQSTAQQRAVLRT